MGPFYSYDKNEQDLAKEWSFQIYLILMRLFYLNLKSMFLKADILGLLVALNYDLYIHIKLNWSNRLNYN